LPSLAVAEETGLRERDTADLAVASCGNAALAAAVVARADLRRLRVFVPTWADPRVVDRLRSLGAAVEECEREPGVAGDPTFHALHAAVGAGAVPFTCQGSENGLAIEGGQTVGYEMVSELGGEVPDRVLVQVGGGALASAVIAALAEARATGAIDRLPRFHAVQTRGGYPLGRAYQRLVDRIAASSVGDSLAYAALHRSEFMWPWEQEPRSVATGILDDETYDWLAVVRGMVETGGSPVVVAEDTLERANDLGRRATGIDADHTGTAGLAGLYELVDRGEVDPAERVAVLFTGVRRAEGVR
jgi:threonine synthase